MDVPSTIAVLVDRPTSAAIDTAAVSTFWQRFLATTDRPAATPTPNSWQFGDSIELANRLLALVLHGPKRATACTVDSYEANDELVPNVGDYSVVCDGEGLPQAIIETTDIRVGPLSSVDDQFAWDEGEGDRTRADWLRMHTAAFTRHHRQIGTEMHPDIPVVFERFAVVYPVLNDGARLG